MFNNKSLKYLDALFDGLQNIKFQTLTAFHCGLNDECSLVVGAGLFLSDVGGIEYTTFDMLLGGRYLSHLLSSGYLL